VKVVLYGKTPECMWTEDVSNPGDGKSTVEIGINILTSRFITRSVRFMGLTENASEAKKDHAELSARVAAGQPIYGETDLSDYVQSVAARNSTWSQLKLSAMPW